MLIGIVLRLPNGRVGWALPVTRDQASLNTSGLAMTVHRNSGAASFDALRSAMWRWKQNGRSTSTRTGIPIVAPTTVYRTSPRLGFRPGLIWLKYFSGTNRVSEKYKRPELTLPIVR